MSARNGDKSRFNRVRKQNIARRQRTRQLVSKAAGQSKSAGVPGRVKSASVPA